MHGYAFMDMPSWICLQHKSGDTISQIGDTVFYVSVTRCSLLDLG